MTTAHLGRILVVDDEPELLAVLSEKLGQQGYDVVSCSSARVALDVLHEQTFDLLLTDLMMPEVDGVAFLRAALQIDPRLAGVIMTGQATVQTAVEALKIGALDYVLKPFKMPTLVPVLARALEVRRLRLENVQLREAVAIDDLCKAIAFTTDLNTILNKLADGALHQCEADEVSVMLPTADQTELCIRAIKGADRDGLLGERVPIDQGIAGWVARTREPMTLSGEIHDSQFMPVRPRSDIRAAISMPMLVGGRLVGILNVNATRRRHPYTLGQVKALAILASAGAAAIEGALLLERLRESETRYRSIFENAVEGISRSTPAGELRTVNPAFAHMLGYDSADELLARVTNAEQLYVNPKERAELAQQLKRQGTIQGFEIRFLRRDGQAIWVALNGHAVRDETGRITGFDCSMLDISDRRRADEALRENEERLRQLAENLEEVIWLGSPDQREILYVSPSFEKVWGRSWASLYAQPWSWDEGIHPEDRPRVREARQRGVQGEPYLQEFRVVRPDGSVRRVRERAFPIRDQTGNVYRVAGVAEDVTQQVLLEEQLRQAQKMEAIGQLSAGVAHDFNNLLTIINGYSDLLLFDLRGDNPSRKLLDEVRNAGERAAALTQQLLIFSRKQVVAPRELNLNEVVAGAENLLRRLIGENVRLTVSLANDLETVIADPGHIEQVLLNLAINARDAMPRGGNLTIETRNANPEDAYRRMDAGVRPGPYVQLVVRDTGCGMTPEVKARIFEPFFTTKAPGKGTGLGLATVFGIVKQAEGTVEVASDPGVGTTFKVYLPRTDRSAASSKSALAIGIPPHGTETVLLVEDDAGVRALTRHVLASFGYTVIEAVDGEQALHVVTKHPTPVQLLVTDVVMPGMGGRELVERLQTLHPEMKVLYLSGYTDDDVVRHGVLHAEVNFLQKPFSTLALACKVREILDARPSDQRVEQPQGVQAATHF